MNPLDQDQMVSSQCSTTREAFSSYLDGAVNGHEMQAIAAHLDHCVGCTQEFSTWASLQQTLASMRRTRAPEDLGLRLRLAISREQAARVSRWQDRLSLFWANTLRPLTLQASAGLACALVLVSTILLLLGVVPPPNAVLANDEPLGAITTPHYLYSVVQPTPLVLTEAANPTIVVEALINGAGRVYDYTVVSAPNAADAPALRSQLRDQLMLSVFKPASVFGMPVHGRVILTLKGVSVHA